jgi:hypothetical protein
MAIDFTVDLNAPVVEENAPVEPLRVPMFNFAPEYKDAVATRLHIANGDASECYIQALLPVTHYYPVEGRRCCKREGMDWYTMLGPLPYEQAVAVYSMLVLDAPVKPSVQ